MKRTIFLATLLVALIGSTGLSAAVFPERENHKSSPVFVPVVFHTPSLQETATSVSPVVDGVPFVPAKGSFGSSGFKSLRSLQLPNRAAAPPISSSRSAPLTTNHYYAPSPMVFFWMPMPGFGPAPAGAGLGWIAVLVIGGVIVAVIVSRRRSQRVLSTGVAEDEEELRMLYDRCEKNLNFLTDRYLEGQTWLDRLDGKIPKSEWNEYNRKYGQISVEDFTTQLKVIREHLDRGEDTTARTLLFSFDDDAVEVFDFLEELEGKVDNLAS